MNMNSENTYRKASDISEQIVKIMLREEGEKAADLKEWLEASPAAEEITGHLSDPEWLDREVKGFIRPELQRLLECIRQRKKRKIILRFTGVAAAVVLLFGISLYWIWPPSEKTQINVTEAKVPLLILENGRNLNLKIATGEWLTENGTSIKNDRQGRIEYRTIENPNGTDEVERWNTLVIPLQCTYQVKLSDGTVVYLNADSRLEYPETFVGKERRVKLQGEAYFEVAGAARPFRVCVKDMQIKVYGTKFNINAYREDQLETVLLEGKVGVTWKNSEKILSPSQLLRLNPFTGEQVMLEVEPDRYIAWTQGYLRYDNDPLEKMMEDLYRWYGVEFKFDSEEIRNRRVTASIHKDLPLHEVLIMIQTTIKVTFIKQERGYLISQPF